ncbi:MAG: hypothetical protein PHO00_08100, partial [bacterium]|nr:hypothetical protein [bacterium]
MKRAPLFLISIFFSLVACSMSVNAAVQDIGAGSTPVAAGTGQVDGVNFTADGEATLTDGQPLNSNGVNQDAAKTYEDGKGTLTFAGDSAVNGDVGVSGGFKLGTINVNGGGTVTFSKTPAGATAVNATNLVFGSAATSDGTVSIADNMNLTAAVTTFTTNTGTLTFVGTSTMTGQIGTSTNLLKRINVGESPEKVTFNNDVYATEIYVADDGEIEFADNADYNRNAAAGTITTESDGYGYIRFKGSSVINASIGTATEDWYDIRPDFADPTDVVEITGDVYTNNGVNFDHDGELQIDGDFYGPVENDSGIADTGTLTLGGNAEIDWLGGAGVNTLKTVNANGTGTLVEGCDFYAQTLNFGGDGEVRLESGMGFDNITNTITGQGTLTIHDAAALTCDIGST